MSNEKNKKKKRGFTIVELVIVIAVIAILAAVLIPTFSGVVEKAKKSAFLSDVRNTYETYVAMTIEDNEYVLETPMCIKDDTTATYYVHIENGECTVYDSDDHDTSFDSTEGISIMTLAELQAAAGTSATETESSSESTGS